VLKTLPLVLFLTATASAAAFRYAEDQSPAIVNPLFTTTMSEARMNELVFEGLYTDDRDLATTALLAESTRVSEDRTQMLVYLRKDVHWHDGQPFTSGDVVFTIQAMADKGTLSTEAGRVEWIKEVSAVDDHTVKIVFKRPEASPEDKLFFKILPAHVFQGTAIKRSDPFRNNPIGTGPYKLTTYNDDSSITLDRVDGYRDPVGLDQVVMREVSDKNYQAKLLLYESLEALVRVLPRDLAVLQNNKKVELYPYQTNSWWYLGFNEKSSQLSDTALRHALCMLVDVESLLAPVGTGDVLSGPFVKSSPFYNHDVAPYAHDAAKAEELLERAGYRKSGPLWTKNGQPLQLHLSAHKSLESSQEVVINLQSQLQSQGIGVDVEFLDDATWKAKIWRERNYDLVLSQWSFDRNEDVREQFHSKGSRNFTGYANPQVDRLLDVARDSTDPQEKKQALRQLHQIVHDDAPMDFLWTLDSYSAMNIKVRGVVIHPFYFFTWMRDWQMQ
jgi:peptide/nickel transport system substrate-binding protein